MSAPSFPLTPLFCVAEVRLGERDVRLRMPFRFGVVTLTEAPQAFVRARIEFSDGRSGWGTAAELLAPKWFDKNLELSNADNFNQLRLALGIAFYAAVRANLPGIAPVALLPEFAGFDMDGFLAALKPAQAIAARHTVGMVDAITAADPHQPVGDGLPETLEQVVAACGQRYFKLKVGGKVVEDMERLGAIAAVLDRMPQPYYASLDGNEQYDDIEGVIELWSRIEADPRLKRMAASILFVEQPINRKVALATDVSALSRQKPVILDESDADLDVFSRARTLGYTGVSSKTCKGLYKSIINAARCVRWNAEQNQTRYFMSGEDLTLQAGVAVQQDLALVNLLGITHVERNGHHYVNGMAGLPEAEQAEFLAAHPDLYERSHGAVRIRIHAGQMDIGSLDCEGFAIGAELDWKQMRNMVLPD